MWRIWRVYCGVTRGEMEESNSRLHLPYTTLPHYPSTSLQWAVFLEETCLIMFILVPHAMCLYLIWSYKGARNARPVQGNHQDINDEKELLSTTDSSKPCYQIIFYGTSDHASFNNKASNVSLKSEGGKLLKCHSTNEHRHGNMLPKPPDYKWGSDNFHKETRHQHGRNFGRLCKRNSRIQKLLSYSVLQAIGWGSVLAFSWTILKSHSLYHHNKQQCPTHYWSLQPEQKIIFDNEPYDQLLKFYENNDKVKDESQVSYNECYDYNKFFDPDVDKSLFSYLYSVASTQPVINSNVKDTGAISKRKGTRKKSVSHQTDPEIVKCEESEYSKCYSIELKPDIKILPSSNDIQQTGLPEKDDITKVEHLENKLPTETSECLTKIIENDDSQSKFVTKKSPEIVTIEDCSESGISSTGSNGHKNNDCQKKREEEELEAKKLIQRELEAIRAIQKDMNGLLQVDLGLSLVDTDPASAVLHFQAGALLGDIEATYNLALCLHMGKGVKQNYKLARKYYSQASEAGHSWATYNLAVLVSSGLGGSVDNDLAYSLLQTAAERNVTQAKEALKVMQQEEEDDYDLNDENNASNVGQLEQSL